MAFFRIALANIRFPPSPAESVTLAVDAVRRASVERADLVCFPECYVPGYRGFGKQLSPPDPKFLELAWGTIAAAAKEFNIGVVLGTERVVDARLRISTLVVDRDGRVAGFQDKVQLDPSEDATYAPGVERFLFRAGALTFGVSICHEGFRYPETFRWAAVRGAQLIVHPHLHMDEGNPDAYRPSSYADPANSFHEKALLCRAAENTAYRPGDRRATAPADQSAISDFRRHMRISSISCSEAEQPQYQEQVRTQTKTTQAGKFHVESDGIPMLYRLPKGRSPRQQLVRGIFFSFDWPLHGLAPRPRTLRKKLAQRYIFTNRATGASSNTPTA
jgi:predicted amidohydrolase